MTSSDKQQVPAQGDQSGKPDEPEGPTDLDKRSWKYVGRKVVREFSDDQCTDQAAALTYYAVLAGDEPCLRDRGGSPVLEAPPPHAAHHARGGDPVGARAPHARGLRTPRAVHRGRDRAGQRSGDRMAVGEVAGAAPDRDARGG